MDADRTQRATGREESTWLDVLLDLRRSPVGIRFLLSGPDYDDSRFPEPATPLPYCTMVKNAAAGRSVKASIEQMSCLGGARALRLIERDNDALSGKRHERLGVYADLCVSRAVARKMVYCKAAAHGVEIGPLAGFTDHDPDTVIVVTTPYNAMRLIQAHAYHHGHLTEIKMSGMQGICEECTSYPFEENRINVSMLCSGTRHVAGWEKDELGVGIPFNQLGSVIDGLKRTATHMDRDPEKVRIAEKLAKYGLCEDAIVLELGKNYYTGAFGRLTRESSNE